MIRHLLVVGLIGLFLNANLTAAPRPGGSGSHGGGRPVGSPSVHPSGGSPSHYPSVSPSYRSDGTGLPPIVIYGSIGRPLVGGGAFPAPSLLAPLAVTYSSRSPHRPYPYVYGGVVASVGYSAYGPLSGYRPLSLNDEIEPPANLERQFGMKVLQVTQGSIAKDADLREGDIILGVGNTRVKNFEELRDALAAATGQVDIVFVNVETGKLERLPITPVNGKIGVAVAPVELK